MTQYSGKIIRKTPVVPTQQAASGVWTVTDAAAAVKNNIWPVAGVPDPISRSCRFRSSATAYYSRGVPPVVTDGKKFTWSGWVKRGSLPASYSQGLIDGYYNNSNFTTLFFYNDTLLFYSYSSGELANIQTTSVFRDPSAWYHVVLTFDSTNATAADRAIIYVNNVRQPTTNTTNPSLNSTGYINATNSSQRLGIRSDVPNYFDGYMTEVNFIDGQALTPSSFGTTDSTTGAWVPMAYTGTYGANGSYVNFKDNTSTTTLGYDYSGNANNWTANNISLTAGTTYDSMLDVPTPWVGYAATTDTTAVTRGNYCVLNPLDKSSVVTLTNGNLAYSVASGSQCRGTLGSPTTGLWYFEHTITSSIGLYTPIIVGASTNTTALSNINNEALVLFFYTDSSSWQVRKGVSGSNTDINVSGTSYPVLGNTLQIAYDSSSGKAWLGKNNSWIDSSGGITGNPSAGTNPTFTFTAGQSISPALFNVGAAYSGVLNCGQNPFTYTPPTGFKALVTTNLPDPTIKLGAQYMAASTYTGTGAALTINNGTNNTTATTFQPDLVWLKRRDSASRNTLFDAVRTANKVIWSDSTDAEGTATAGTGLTAFNSNGFALGTEIAGTSGSTNINAGTYVGWQWKAAGSSVSNTSGSITSTVNAGTTQGFSVVTYTLNNSTFTVGHGLGVAPSMILVKNLDTTNNWDVYHVSIGAGYRLVLNATDAKSSSTQVWNNTAPTSTVFSGNSAWWSSPSTSRMVAYCFAEVAGYSKFSSYTGNGSADGPFVYLGFRPRYVMIKSTGVEEWRVVDTARSTYNIQGATLYPNSSGAENSGQLLDINSNGFKIRTADGAVNGSGTTYIYMAFAENPFKYSNAR